MDLVTVGAVGLVVALLAWLRSQRLGPMPSVDWRPLVRWLTWWSLLVFVVRAIEWIANGGLFPGRR